jgi:Ca2+-binding RTX toxin-like protein
MAVIFGTSNSEHLYVDDGVTWGSDLIYGFAGDDWLYGLAGDDVLDGGMAPTTWTAIRDATKRRTFTPLRQSP